MSYLRVKGRPATVYFLQNKIFGVYCYTCSPFCVLSIANTFFFIYTQSLGTFSEFFIMMTFSLFL